MQIFPLETPVTVPPPHIHFVTGKLAEHSLRQVLESLAKRARRLLGDAGGARAFAGGRGGLLVSRDGGGVARCCARLTSVSQT